jgi:1-deoxyxylulose-5-phosphate synthase
MEYVRLGQSGLRVSRLCLGTMNMGTPDWKPWVFNEAQSAPIVRAALEAGINFIDLADFYSAGIGEEVVGRILSRLAKRDEIVLTTKVGYPIGAGANNAGHSRKHIFDAIDASLKRIGTDYVDIYMLHFYDAAVPAEETMRALDDIVRSGRARYIGVSTMYTWQLAKLLAACKEYGLHRPINMQLQLNLAYREEEREMIPYCLDQGMGISVFSPLARGLLSGDANSTRNRTDFFTNEMYGDAASQDIALAVQRVAARRGVPPARIAQAWVLGRKDVTSMLVGADSPEQLSSALGALELTLDDDERHELERCYTPCDLINDENAATRLPRSARPATGAFA